MRACYQFAMPFLAILALGACQGRQGAGPSRPAPEVQVQLVNPERLTISTELPGRTVAFRIAEVRPQVSGIVLKRLFTEGAAVAAGQVLYELDPAPYRAVYDSATAAVAKAEANLTTARLKNSRYEKLIATGAVALQDRDDVLAALKQAEADLATARAGSETARINLGYTRMAAPISGWISTSAVTEGALVTANQTTALSTIQQFDPIYVDLTQTSDELMQLRRDLAEGRVHGLSGGQARVHILMSDGSEYAQMGTLEFSGITVSAGTSAITLRAVVPNPGRILLPGMFVRARVEEGVEEQAILVPQQAVSRDTRGAALALVLGAHDQVEQRELRLGRAVGDRWQVLEGLSSGDRLIIEGGQRVRVGAVARALGAGGSGGGGGAAGGPGSTAAAR